MTQPQAPTTTDVQQAAIDAYNQANDQVNVAARQLWDLQQNQRPSDPSDAAQYDLNYRQAATALESATTQRAAAARAYTQAVQQSIADGKPSPVSAPSNEQYLITRDPQSGKLSTLPNPNYVASAGKTVTLGNDVYERQPDGTYKAVITGNKAPKIVAGTSSNDQYLIIEDAAGNRSTLANPNYQPPKGSLLSSADSTNRYIVRQNPDGTTTQTENPNYVPPKPSELAANPTQQYIVRQNPDGTTSSFPNPNYQPPKPTVIGGADTQDQYIVKQNPDGTTTKEPNPNYVPPKPTLAAGGTANDKYIVTMGPDGNFTQTPNPNYQAPKPQVLNFDSTAPFIPILKTNPDGTYEIAQAPNPNGLTVNQAFFDFTGTLRNALGKDADNQVPLSVAKDLATSALDAMNAQTARQQANNQGANIGAGLLNQRVSSGSGMLNNILGLAGNKNFGIGGPIPSGLGTGLMNDIYGFTTRLGGGQSVYDTAANLVHAANPNLQGTPMGAASTAILSQMLTKTGAAGNADTTTGTNPNTVTPNPPASAPTAPAQLPSTGYQGFNPNVFGSGTGPYFQPPNSVDQNSTVASQIGEAVGKAIAQFQPPKMVSGAF